MTAGDIWARYVRYIGAGAVATAGILTVLRGLPTMASAFLAVARGLRRDASGSGGAVERTDRDLPAWFVFGGVATVVLVAGLVPGVFAGNMAPVQRAVLAAGVGVFGVLFVTVAARIVGIVGVSSQPTSGIALVTLLGTASIFAAAGWVDAGARAARPDRRHHRGDRREQGRRHLAGPEDRLARGRDARAPAARAADRRRLRLLGGGGDGAPARQGLHLRVAGSSPRPRPRS